MKKLVVIGGGFAGSYIAKKLQNKFEVTLIDTKDYFEFTPGILRTIIEPNHIKKIQVLHKNYLKKTKVIVGHVKEIKKDKVLLEDESIDYDYLAICSGTKYELPIKEQDIVSSSRANNLIKYSDKLSESKEILIIGGGVVGVELAAEIATKYKDKHVTIVHAGSRLIDRNNEKTIEYVEKFINKIKVDVIYNEKIESVDKNKIFSTNKDRRIKADIAFWCTGVKPNFEFLGEYLKSNISERNFIKVNNYLQLSSNSNIFSAGDITSFNEEKTAQNARKQAKILVKNLLALDSDKKLVEYISESRPTVISLGKSNAVLTFKDKMFSGFLISLMKKLIEKKEMLFFKI